MHVLHVKTFIKDSTSTTNRNTIIVMYKGAFLLSKYTICNMHYTILPARTNILHDKGIHDFQIYDFLCFKVFRVKIFFEI